MNLSLDELKKIIIKSGLVKPEEFDAAVEVAHDQNKSIVAVLSERGQVLEKFLGQIIADYLKVPYADIRDQPIHSKILSQIPENFALNKRVAAFAQSDGQLEVAMEDPKDIKSISVLEKKTAQTVVPFFTLPEVLNQALDFYRQDVEKDFEKIILESASQAKGYTSGEELPVIKLLETLLEFAAAKAASDVHIENVGDKVVVRFRVYGKLQDVLELPAAVQQGIITRIKILTNLKIDEHRIPQDGRFRFRHLDDEISVRVSILPTYFGEDAELRLLSAAERPKTLDDLGLRDRNLEIVLAEIKKPSGMILSTGPTGSGKTTTLYDILNLLNTEEVNICTVEDPIEYGLRRVNQVQINPITGLTFAAGLRSILRHDPNIILVGEIRDAETAEIAVHAALTGHLLLSSLHTADAVSTIPRLYDLGVQPYLIGSTLRLVIAQRLVAKSCQSCLDATPLEQSLIEGLKERFGAKLPKSILDKNLQLHVGKGCPVCNHTGFLGRIGLFEVLKISEKIKELIFKKATAPQILAQATAEGFKTILEDGVEKVESGLTTLEEVIRVAVD